MVAEVVSLFALSEYYIPADRLYLLIAIYFFGPPLALLVAPPTWRRAAAALWTLCALAGPLTPLLLPMHLMESDGAYIQSIVFCWWLGWIITPPVYLCGMLAAHVTGWFSTAPTSAAPAGDQDASQRSDAASR